MKISNLVTAVATTVILSTVSLPAFAQIRLGVSNDIKYSTGTDFSRSNLELDQKTNFVQENEVVGEAQTIKIEALTGNGGLAEVNLDFDGNKFTGDATANINTNEDPVVLGAFQTSDIYQFSRLEEEIDLSGNVRSGSDNVTNRLQLDASTYLNR